MRITLLKVPYDSGHREARMGRGPGYLLDNGLEEKLGELGHDVAVEPIESAEPFQAEIATAFELYRKLAERVRAAASGGRLPVILSGNCGSAVGTMAGIGAGETAVAWFDAHGDFNTPETTTSGFLDGMGLAVLTGRGWREMASGVAGFRPLGDADVVHVGGRDFDPLERRLLDDSGVTVVTADDVKRHGASKALAPALEALATRCRGVYLHFDLDVLDLGEARANDFGPPGGLTVEQVVDAIRTLRRRLPVRAAAIASVDPAFDADGRVIEAGGTLLAAVLDDAGTPAPSGP